MTSAVDRLVRAVLYEGYALYPYRPSALKNRKRFAFGAVYPRAWAERTGEPWTMRAECVVEGGREVAISVRFLVLHRGGGATEEVLELPPRPLEPWEGRAVFGRGPLTIHLASAIVAAGGGLWRIAVEIENRTAIDPALDREAAMDATLASTHTLVRAIGGRAVSTIDPPPHAAAAAAACRTLGAYPVVAAHDTVLVSPIVLPDLPEVAPESPGDFFDGTEIDELLVLRIQTLTPDEQAEAIAADPRIGAMIERVRALTPEAAARLHGVASVGPRPGTRVRLRPAGGADAFDGLLFGRTAHVVAVERDLDGRVLCAVTIDDDPGADLGERGMPGHRFYFRPEELEVLR